MGRAISWLMAIALMALAAPMAAAQDYPTRSIVIVVPYAPGGVTDVLARLAASKMQGRLGQPVVIENKPGGRGLIGTDYVARSEPDGYTLTMMIDTNTIAPSLYTRVNFDPTKDFEPISLMAKAAQVIVANPKLAANDIHQFVAYAKAQPAPLVFASPGVGTSHFLAMQRLMLLAGVKLDHVPYKGGGQAVNDLIAGHVSIGILGIAPALPPIQAGMLKPLAVTSIQRLAVLPDVPTVAEAGFAGFDTYNWFGLLAPKETPAPIVQRLHQEIVNVMHDPELKSRFDALSLEITTSKSPDDFRNFLIDDERTWAKIIKASGIKLQ